MPFSSKLVRAEDCAGDQMLTIYNTKWFWHDNIVFLTVLMPAGFVWFTYKVP